MPWVMIKSDPRAREKPCIRCGYSLRKVTDSIHCPECGLSVWLSLNNNNTLEASNPEWLGRSAVALLVLAAASLIAFAALLPGVGFDFQTMHHRQEFLRILRSAQFSDDPNAPPPAALLRLRPPTPNFDLLRRMELIAAAALALQLTALFLLTTAEGRYPDKLLKYRVAARFLCAAGGLVLIFHALGFARAAPPDGLPARLTHLLTLLAAVIAWSHLRELARRAPSKPLMRLATVMAVIPLVSVFYDFIREGDWLPNLIPLLYLPASAGLFVYLALFLRREAGLAEKNWKTETARPESPNHKLQIPNGSQ